MVRESEFQALYLAAKRLDTNDDISRLPMARAELSLALREIDKNLEKRKKSVVAQIGREAT